MTIQNVTTGDKFKHGKNLTAIVVDFHQVFSMIDNKIIKYICIAKLLDASANNTFEIPFSSVVRNKI